MFRPGEIEGASLAVERTFSDMELRIMDDIVRRIRINGEITRSADWQIHRLHELGASDMAVRGYIQSCLEYSEREMDELYYDVLRRGYYRDGAIYRQTGDDQIPFEENAGLQQLISAVSDQTSGEMKNITQSLGFAVRENGRLRFLPIADYYQRTLDGAMFDIASGAFDYNTVLRRVTKEMTNSGLRTVDYATGRSIRVESAARMCVMTGFSQLTAKINEQNADALGTEYFEVTYHGGARPEHQEWQGKVYTKDELYSVCGLGAPDGLCGCNCYHDYFPFFPGISERAYTDEELDRMNREENTPKEYHDREYTAYQATQRQRSLERSMRAQRQQIHLLQTGGADEKEIMLARGKYRSLSSEYTNFSKAMNIPQQRERVTVDGLGSVGKGRYTNTDEPARIPSLGSRITDKVTDEERRELLTRGGRNTNSEGGNSTPGSVANSSESGIIVSRGLTKLNEKGEVVNPMDSQKYQTMKSNLEKHGCSVIAAHGDDERFLKAFGAEAISDRKGIIHLGNVPSASAFFEEIIHFSQMKKYGELESTDFIERAAREVAANRMLLKNGKSYGFTKEDFDDIRDNLTKWEKDFIKRVGVNYDESDIKREI